MASRRAASREPSSTCDVRISLLQFTAVQHRYRHFFIQWVLYTVPCTIHSTQSTTVAGPEHFFYSPVQSTMCGVQFVCCWIASPAQLNSTQLSSAQLCWCDAWCSVMCDRWGLERRTNRLIYILLLYVQFYYAVMWSERRFFSSFVSVVDFGFFFHMDNWTYRISWTCIQCTYFAIQYVVSRSMRWLLSGDGIHYTNITSYLEPVVHPRYIHGTSTVYPRCIHGTSTVHSRCIHVLVWLDRRIDDHSWPNIKSSSMVDRRGEYGCTMRIPFKCRRWAFICTFVKFVYCRVYIYLRCSSCTEVAQKLHSNFTVTLQ